MAPLRFLIPLAVCASPALALSAAHADPEVPAGAICDAVAPVVAGTPQDQDGSSGTADPTQSLAKAQQIQGILGRIQQNGGLTGGASGDDINAVIRAAQSGDIGAAAAAGSDLANVLRPQITGEGNAGEDRADEAKSTAEPAQGKPLVDQGMLDTARNAVRQGCERAAARQRRSDDSPASSSSDETSSDDED
ncbi:MAG: hypothetical protein ACRC20_01740 [Segniliparus sp.]|uniref:hypothetical protein n=1 Tax=Segniliparus sp. TaxID=2804064 RepID=UPI003F38D665